MYFDLKTVYLESHDKDQHWSHDDQQLHDQGRGRTSCRFGLRSGGRTITVSNLSDLRCIAEKFLIFDILDFGENSKINYLDSGGAPVVPGAPASMVGGT